MAQNVALRGLGFRASSVQAGVKIKRLKNPIGGAIGVLFRAL